MTLLDLWRRTGELVDLFLCWAKTITIDLLYLFCRRVYPAYSELKAIPDIVLLLDPRERASDIAFFICFHFAGLFPMKNNIEETRSLWSM